MTMYKKWNSLNSSPKGALAKLRKTADTVFSEYIRLKYSANNLICWCVTCNTPYYWHGTGQMHCGHYMSRRFIQTRYNEDNCRPQCIVCNSFKEGLHGIFRVKLVEEIGEERVKTVESLAMMRGLKKFDRLWYQDVIKEYRSKLKVMKVEKGVA